MHSMVELPISDAGDLFALPRSPARSRASSRASSDYQRLQQSDTHVLHQPRLVADLQQQFGMTPKRVYGKKPGPKNLFRDEPHVETPADIATSLRYPGPIKKARSLQHGSSRRERRVSKTEGKPDARATASRQRGVETASPTLSYTSSTTSSSWQFSSDDVPIENAQHDRSLSPPDDITPVSTFFPDMPLYRAPDQIDEFSGIAPVQVSDDSELYVRQFQHPQSPHSHVTSSSMFSSSSLAAALDSSAFMAKGSKNAYPGVRSHRSPESRRHGYESDSSTSPHSSYHEFQPPPPPPPSSVNSVTNSPLSAGFMTLPSSYSPPALMGVQYAATTSSPNLHTRDIMLVGGPATQNTSSLSGWAG